jgi:hypothetical protein
MTRSKFLQLNTFFLLLFISSSSFAAAPLKAGWSSGKVELQAKQCIDIFNQDLCNDKEHFGTAKLICSGSALRTLCGCLSTMVASLLTHKTLKDKPIEASNILHTSGGFERCLDDITKNQSPPK